MSSRNRGLLLALVIGLFMSRCLFAGKEFLAGAGEQVVANQLVVGLQAGADINQIIAALVPQAIANPVGSHLNIYVLQLPPAILAAASKLLAAHPLVKFVEPNHIRNTTVLPPNDPKLTLQWDLTTVQAVQAWSYLPDRYLTAATAGTNRVKVALIDTGVDCTHPDFMNAGGSSTDSSQGGQLDWTDSVALVETTVSPKACDWQDDFGHGTHTGGTIAAATNNATGVASTGFPLQLIVYKVFDTSGNATDTIIATAIDDAVNAGAQVISMSLGGAGYSQAMQQAMDYAWEHNVLVVAAAGNTGNDANPLLRNSLQYPGGGNHVLGVAATDSNNLVANFSTYGNWIKIAGPGVNILSTTPTYSASEGLTLNYGTISGTSMATPHVAAVGGLLYMLYPNLSVADIAQRLQQTATTPNTGWDQYIGYGVVNAGAALGGTAPTATLGSLVGQVVDTFSNPITGAVVTAGDLSFTTAVDPSTGNDDGLFRLANLNPGTYAVTVTATGFPTVNMQAVVVAGADTMLTIPMGASLGEFTGVVTYNSIGVAGAAVEATSGGLIQGATVTNASGDYTMVLAAGAYTLTASAPNYINATSGSQNLTGGGTVTVNLSLSAMGNLIGTVTDANGLGVAGAHIDFTSSGFSGGAATAANGSYSTFGIPAGTYTVTASASGYSGVTLNGVSVTANTSTVANLQFSTGVSLTSGLLGYWPFDEDTGTVAYDQSGNGYNAALSNTTWTTGKFNSAVDFYAGNSVGVTPAIPFTNAFSVSAWANSATTSQNAYARIAETQQTSGLMLGMDITGRKYKFVVNSGTGATGTCGSQYGCAEGGTVTTGWHLVTGTYDGTTSILYVDGAMVASDTAAAPANAAISLYMGEANGGGYEYSGALDDMRLYSRALTALEVSSLFSQGAAPNLGLTKTADAATVPAGASIGYTLTVSNSGGIATSAALSDPLPAGTGINWSISPAYSGPGTCSIASQVLTCNFGSLGSNATATVHVTSATSTLSCAGYTNTASLSASNNATVQASATTTVQCPNLTLTKTADAATVAAGAAIGYTLAASNTGTGTATSATLSDPLPAGTGVNWSISPAYSGPGTCSITSQTLTCNFGSLGSNATATVHVTSATSTLSCAGYTNTASLSASNNPTVQASATTTVQCPNLTLTKTADAATVAAGAAIGYTLAVSNAGTGTATSATLSDPLPTGTGINWSISPAYSGPGTCSIASQILTCNFGTLASNATATVHVTSATSTSSCAGYTNTASLSASNNATVQASATTTVQCPNLTLTKTADAATVAAGAAIGYTLAVSNAGTGTATSATLSDPLPTGTGINWSISPAYSGPGTCSIASQTLTCNFGTLASNATATVHMTSTTSTSSCAGYTNTASLSASNNPTVQASATTTVQCPNLTLTKTADAATVAAGAAIGYTLAASNTGTGTATSSTLSDPLPAGTGVNWSISPAYSGPGTCSIASQILTCNFGTLASNATATVHVTSATSTSSCAGYTNIASLNASNSATVQASATTTVQCPNLTLTKTADAATAAAGAAIGYTLAASNTGTGTATSATLSDPLPTGTGINWSISPAYSGPGTCSIASQTLTCNFGTLASNATATVHVTSTTSTSNCAGYTNTVNLSASNSATVQASATTTVQCPSLTLTKTADAATVAAGAAIGYTLVVGNAGTGAATSATLSDPLPAGTGVNWSISPAYSGPGTCSIASQTLTCNFGTLASNATATVHVTSATSTSNCTGYTNTASLSASNNATVQASATTTVQCPSLTLTKTADAATVAAGAAIGYTLAVSNTGTGTATSATLSDPLPAGTGVNWSVSPAYSGPGTCSIASQTLTCNFGNLASNATATVHVASSTSTSSCATYTNVATANASNGSTLQASATTTVLCPVLTIQKTHSVTFTQGQPTVAYTVAVSNSSIVPSSGVVSVTETLPIGLTLVSMAGTGWICPSNVTSCTRNDPLGGGAVYPAITVIVNVNADAPSQVTNLVTVSGGGSASASTTDPTSISPFTCDLNGDHVVNVIDVQIIINEALGLIPPVNDLNHDGVVNVADVQKEINAALGLGCPY